MKEAELRKHATCSICKQPIGASGLPLPPSTSRSWYSDDGHNDSPVYTADQMLTYGRACAKAADKDWFGNLEAADLEIERLTAENAALRNRKPVATIYIVDGSMTIHPGLVVTSEAGEAVFDVFPREAQP